MMDDMKPLFKQMIRLLLVCILTVNFHVQSVAIELPSFFSSHMVLQRNKPIRLWGWAKPGEKISVVLHQQLAKTTAGKDGFWQVSFAPMQAGGPYVISIKGIETLQFNDVWIGDVWFCSGQSNMEWPMNAVDLPPAQMKLLENQHIRVFTTPHAMASDKQIHLKGGTWKPCIFDIMGEFSAVATYFAHYLQPEIGVPVGLVVSAWGGTDIEAWMNPAVLGTMDKHQASLYKLKEIGDPETFRAFTEDLQRMWNDTLETYDEGIRQRWFANTTDFVGWDTLALPGVWDALGYKGEGVGWFKRTFQLSAKSAAGPVIISIGAVHNKATLYVNGEIIPGPHKVGMRAVYVVPPAIVKEGINHLAVKVYKYWSYGGFTGKAEDMFVSTMEGMQKLSGTWYFKPGYLGRNPTLTKGPNSYRGSLYNAMIHPFGQLSIKGILWYQGENNVGRPHDYAWHLQAMIEDWRRLWSDTSLSFFIVQLPNFKGPSSTAGNYALIRHAQQAATSLPHVYVAVTIDVGDSLDIHPKKKAPVGYRLSLLARKYVYRYEQLVAEGPAFKKATVSNKMIELEFDHVGSGLMCTSPYGYIYGFELSDKEGKWKPVPASLKNDRVVIEAETFEMPVKIRYAWADNPQNNLYNREGLPAAPFEYTLQPNR